MSVTTDAGGIITALALLFLWQGISLTLFLRVARRGWEELARQSDTVLRRIGTAFLLIALGLALWGAL